MLWFGKSRFRTLSVLAVAVVMMGSIQSPVAATEHTAQIWPQKTIIHMPVGGTITRIPSLGSRVDFRFVQLNPKAVINPLVPANLDQGEAEALIQFESPSYLQQVEPILSEYKNFRSSLNEHRARFGLDQYELSASVDVLGLRPNSGLVAAKLGDLKSIIKAVLMVDEMIDLRATEKTPCQPHPIIVCGPTLETAISSHITDHDLAILSALTGLHDARGLVETVLAEEVRLQNNVRTPVVDHPSAPFVKVQVNDPGLRKKHIWKGSLDQFYAYVSRYCTVAAQYWTAVETKELFNKDDWKYLQAARRPYQKVLRPSELVQRECQSVEAQRKDNLNRDLMLKSIIKYTLEYFFSGWPADAPEALDDRGEWLAVKAAKELGLDESLAKGHSLDSARVTKLFVNYGYASNMALPEWSASQDKQFTEHKVRSAMALLVPTVFNHISSLEWTNNFYGFLGGTEVRPGIMLPASGAIELPSLNAGIGAQILRSMYETPWDYDAHRTRLDSWRSDVLKQVEVRQVPPINLFLNDLWLSYAREMSLFAVAFEIKTKTQELHDALIAMNSVLGYSDSDYHGTGVISLPEDTIVDAIYPKVGEFVADRRPLATVSHLFKRNARMFVRHEELGGLMEGAAFLISVVPPLELPDGVALLLAVASIQPNDIGTLTVDLELTPVFQLANSRFASRLPDFLPLQSRYCITDILPDETCATFPEALPSFGEIKFKIERRVY